jgi:hypothetical protein
MAEEVTGGSAGTSSTGPMTSTPAPALLTGAFYMSGQWWLAR